MARYEYVLAQAMKLDILEQVRLISTLAHKVEKEVRREGAKRSEAPQPEADTNPGTGN